MCKIDNTYYNTKLLALLINRAHMKGVFPVIKHVVHPSKYEMQPISYMIAQYSQVTVVSSLIVKISLTPG